MEVHELLILSLVHRYRVDLVVMIEQVKTLSSYLMGRYLSFIGAIISSILLLISSNFNQFPSFIAQMKDRGLLYRTTSIISSYDVGVAHRSIWRKGQIS